MIPIETDIDILSKIDKVTRDPTKVPGYYKKILFDNLHSKSLYLFKDYLYEYSGKKTGFN